MDITVSTVLGRSFDRAVTRSGAVLMVMLLVITLVFTTLPSTLLDPAEVPDAFIMGLLNLIGFTLSLLVVAIAIRTFLQDETRFIPRDVLTDRLGSVTVNMVLGQLVAIALIGIGFLLIIPGLYLLVSLVFWYVYVADQNTDFIDAYRQSWRITHGHRWRILALLLIVFMATILLQGFATLLGAITPGILLNTLLWGMASAFITVWWAAVITETYKQIQR